MARRAKLELEALHEIGGVLWRGGDINKAFTSTLTILRLVLEMENGTISLFDPVTGEVFVEAAPEMTDEERIQGRLRPGEGVVGRIFACGMPMVVPDIGAEPLFLNRTGSWRDLASAPRAFVGVPVRHALETLGVLTIDRLHGAGPVSFDRDVRFLTLVAGMLGARVRLQGHEAPIQLKRADLGAREPPGTAPFGVVATGRRMREVMDQVERVAQSRATVLLRGESGTGKEVVARALHDASPRAERPFVAVNCAALTESLLESELFGHEKGAFTGAVAAKPGRFEMADGGTLFLDEVGELTAAAQVKLLRAVQERRFERVGGRRTITVDVRIVAATNRDLEQAVHEGSFRLDLYHRLSVVTLELPPLRERCDEIPALAEHFLRVLSQENGRAVALAPDGLEALLRCRWSGNVRQLRNCLERAIVTSASARLGASDLCLDGEVCGVERVSVGAAAGSLVEAVRAPAEASARAAGAPRVNRDAPPPGGDERERVVWALARCGHVQAKAARMLGMSVRQLRYRVRKFGIALERF
ncbi:MAG TPA: nif-specific transcriptional activator NifA [Anaeromyxobacteraceae bacterium]|nr:nif-specific transcriptional activator NifA [Anaeromyxobacteraceae bacterium]